MKKQIKISFYFTALSTIGLGIIYPAILSAVALLIPTKPPAILTKPIEQDDLFNGRPTMRGGPYSGASNLSLTNPQLSKQVDERLKILTNYAPGTPIPGDLLFASGSGYDPDISVGAAKFQINRISKARNISSAKIEELISQYTHTKAFGFIGTDHVNVVEINEGLKNLTSEKASGEP